MVIKCIENKVIYEELIIPCNPNEGITSGDVVTSGGPFDDIEPCYAITVGSTYFVYGVIAWKNQVFYLVFDDEGYPQFYNEKLFQVVDSSTVFDWEISHLVIDNSLMFVLGYSEIVHDYRQLVALLSGDKGATRIFLNYREHCEKLYGV